MESESVPIAAEDARKPIRIGILGHYGNQNLGDESIIEAVIRNLRQRLPDADIVCLSIDPFDSQARHGVDAFPIRYRSDFFEPRGPAAASVPEKTPPAATKEPPPDTSGAPVSWKARLKTLPVLGIGFRALANALDLSSKAAQERRFLTHASDYLRGMDILLVTGSNQFLDNFGGPWGFPYTLLKWTLLAKRHGTKVAFISVGAGPLSHPLSFFMLKLALRRADYLSFRDQGSLDLIHSRIGLKGHVYPDLAHSLGYPRRYSTADASKPLTIAVNPMPVYDSRYWHQADNGKYCDYVRKVAELCREIEADGHRLALFSTQEKDENVITDVLSELTPSAGSEVDPERISVDRNRTVQELMDNLAQADLVVATRFHATVLPLQLGVPVLGICYYRKAAELLQDVGLGDYQVSIDKFEASELIRKYRELIERITQGNISLDEEMRRYRDALDQQYREIVRLATKEESR